MRFDVLRDVIAALQPAARQVGAAASVDVANRCRRDSRVARLRHADGFDDIVVCDDAHDIFRRESFHQLRGGLAGCVQLGSVHGAGTIEDDGKVERSADGRGRRIRFDFEERTHEGAMEGVRFLVEKELSFHMVTR